MRIAEISVPAIRHNVRRIREHTGGTVIAVIKANGYGHGAEIVARAAIEGGAALLGVTDLEEALALRDAGIEAPILCWLHGAAADFDAAVEADLEIGVSHLAQLEALAAAAGRAGRRAIVQFKVDTGLSRNGAAPAEWPALFARGAELESEGRVRVRGVFSHLANAGEDNDLEQARRFDGAVELLRAAGCDPDLIHLAASAATFSSARLHYNTVRVGVVVYGLSPFADRTSADLGLIPAMTLRSQIVALRDVPPGTGVSYGYNHLTQGETTLGLVPIGYADGMPRALNGGGATVSVAEHHCPIVGRIGMDQCIVDLGSLGRKVRIGDPVVLFGDPATGVPPVEVWAELMRTINYEIVVGIGSRVRRVAVDDDGPGAFPPAGPAALPPTGSGSGVAVPPPERVEGDGAPRIERIEIADPESMHELGRRLGRRLAAGDLVILTGPLGAGKTALARGIGEALGVRGPVTSPTFVLARTHPPLGDGPPLIHVDAYRLAGAGELDDLDLDLDGAVVVAEWGSGLFDEHGSWIEVTIERPTGSTGPGDTVDGDGLADESVEPRAVAVAGHGPRWRSGVLT
nr:alanine racemase [Leucobacter weissii]